MKTTFFSQSILILLISLSGLSLDAQSKVSQQEVDLIQGTFEDNEHLFPILMPDYAIQNNYEETKKSFVVHFRDSFKNFSDPNLFQFSNVRAELKKTNPLTIPVKGTMTYVGFFKAKYAYDLSVSDRTFTYEVRVHFKSPQGTDLQDFERKLQLAQEIWNQSMALEQFEARFGIDFKSRFLFKLETNPRKAHFSVNIADSTRGPYYSEWARNWTPIVIAHEVAHMLGLGDEYETISGNDDCLNVSLMCESWTGQMMGHHYYHVLKRLF
jgi:hypothetical protein